MPLVPPTNTATSFSGKVEEIKEFEARICERETIVKSRLDELETIASVFLGILFLGAKSFCSSA